MNRQISCNVPIPIVEQIILFATLKTQLAFRSACLLFKYFIDTRVHVMVITTFYNDKLLSKLSCSVLDSSNTILFVCDEYKRIIWNINLFSGKMTILSKISKSLGWLDGVGKDARFCDPRGLALDEKAKLLYVSDYSGHSIRSISLESGQMNTLCGRVGSRGGTNGLFHEAMFDCPNGLCFDADNDYLYVADGRNNSIRKILLREKKVETLCGGNGYGHMDGSFEEAKFDRPYDIVLNPITKELYVSDFLDSTIRVISLKTRTVSTLCGIS